ncbi:MAG: Stf0 family sulfotransferase [Isosphaeraceae bacterium]
MSSTDPHLNCGKAFHEKQLRDLATYITYRAKAAQNRSISDYRKYLIFSTPRVGSTLLTKQIQQTNQLGSPEEWFNPDFITAFLGLQNTPTMDFNLFAEQVIRGSATPNNVFGVNVHVHQYHQLLNSGIDLFKPTI